MKKVFSLLLALMLLASLLPAAALADDYPVVRFMTTGPAPAGWEAAQEAINEKLRTELNCEIEIVFAGWDNYASRMQMAIAAGEKYSFVYDSNSNALAANMAAGYYLPMDDLIAEYGPTLYSTKGETVWEANKIPGPDGEYRIYAIPNGSTFQVCYQYWIRKDIREKLGFEEIKSQEDLIKFAYAVKEAYPDMVPMVPSKGNYRTYASMANIFDMDKMPGYIPVTPLDVDGVLFLMNNDGKYYNVFDDMPEAMWENIQEARKLYLDGIIDPDVLTNTEDKFFQGQAAILNKLDLGVNGDAIAPLLAIEPEAEIESVTFYDYENNGKVFTDFKHWDFICMPVTCPDPALAIKVLDWFSQDQAHYDMLESGVEGYTWTAVGEKQYIYNADLWERMSWRYLRTACYERFDANFTDEEIGIINNNWQNDAWFGRSVTTGFSFDPSNVQTEVSIASAAISQYWYAILDGAVDPEEGMAEFKAAAYDAVVAVQKELQRQLDAYLAK